MSEEKYTPQWVRQRCLACGLLPDYSDWISALLQQADNQVKLFDGLTLLVAQGIVDLCTKIRRENLVDDFDLLEYEPQAMKFLREYEECNHE